MKAAVNSEKGTRDVPYVLQPPGAYAAMQTNALAKESCVLEVRDAVITHGPLASSKTIRLELAGSQ